MFVFPPLWERKTQLIHCDPSLIRSVSTQSLCFLPSFWGFFYLRGTLVTKLGGGVTQGLELRAEPRRQVSLRGAKLSLLREMTLVNISVKTGDVELWHLHFFQEIAIKPYWYCICINLLIFLRVAQRRRMFILKFSEVNVSLSGSKTNLHVRFWRTATELALVSVTHCSPGSLDSLDRWRKCPS